MTREEEFTHEGFEYANNIYVERKCELFEIKDIAHDFVQGAIYADSHPRKGLWDAEKVCKFLYEKIIDITYLNKDNTNEHYDKDEFIEYLQKAMED